MSTKFLDYAGLSKFLENFQTALAANDTEKFATDFAVAKAGKAGQLAVAKKIGISGDVTGTGVDFNGTQDITISTTIATVEASVSGQGGKKGLMTAPQAEKLGSIAAGAQVNVIEEVQVNGVALTPSNKSVNVVIPAATVTDVQTKLTEDGNYSSAIGTGSTVAKIDLSVYALKSQITSVLDLQGTKETYAELPTTGVKKGDVWLVSADNAEYVCTAVSPSINWEKLGPTIDLSGYALKSTKINNHKLESDITLNGSDIALSSNYAAVSAAAPAAGDSLDTAVAKLQAEIGTKANTADLGTAAYTASTAYVPSNLTPAEANAQVNVIETVKVNGSALTPDANKAVDITIPAATVTDVQTKTSTSGSYSSVIGTGSTVAKIDLSGYALSANLGTAAAEDTTAFVPASLTPAEAGAQVNVIETVKVNGTALTVTSKAVDVPVPVVAAAIANNDTGYATGDQVYDYIEAMAIDTGTINGLFGISNS